MTLREEMISKLIMAKIPSPRLETDIILQNAAPEYPQISKEEQEKVDKMLKRRINHEPLDKIIGKKAFYKSEFKVNSHVLSPRPDTEILVENALNLLSQDKENHILDLGTGSGCILLSLLKECEKTIGIGLDISKEALKVAKENAEYLGVSDRVEFICGTWKEEKNFKQTFDIIVSNPPYIPSAEIKELETEVKDYDPLLALDGGKDGVICYREIAEIAPKLLKKGGYILLEVGYNQAEIVADIFTSAGLKLEKIAKDLAEINRCVILKKDIAK